MLSPCESVADIGCDHAYLAIHLIENKLAKKVYACDINKGPLKTAQKNINLSGYADKIETILTDGLNEVDKKEPDAVIICGMGGDLIAKIISNSNYTKERSPQLLLQPMTKARKLREYLLTNGYEITDEATVYDGRIYQIIKARYNINAVCEYNKAELLIGKQNNGGDEFYIPLAIQQRSSLLKALEGVKKSGGASPEKEEQIKELEKIIEEIQ